MIAVAAHDASTRSRVKISHFQTRSMFEINFNAKAISTKPITTLTLLSQPPDFGSDFIAFGKSARIKNGRAKTVAKIVMPINGVTQSPRLKAMLRLLTMGTVHVKLVSEKTKPIMMTDMALFLCCIACMFSLETTPEG